MLLTRLYYSAKPYLPWRLRLGLRRWHAKRIRRRSGDVWPILESAGRKPDGWPDWPDGKQFAFVLTHDVESQRGLDRVKPLAELEIALGFRSCFNFIPEGPYRLPPDLRSWLTDRGFEVGVHDLRHDGGLFASRKTFVASAPRINRYVKDWGACGFRSGFMLRNLDWLHELDIQYDASTFDTDPFEPQPAGQGTIFPFWVPCSGPQDYGPRTTDLGGATADHGPRTTNLGSKVSRPVVSSTVSGPWSVVRGARTGYIELPYTLPQDSTLFLVLRERSPAIWLRKLDWIAAHQGMVLVDTHPDYMALGGHAVDPGLYPVQYYGEFLDHVRSAYGGRSWHALPREVAAYVAYSRSSAEAATAIVAGAQQDAGLVSRRDAQLGTNGQRSPVGVLIDSGDGVGPVEGAGAAPADGPLRGAGRDAVAGWGRRRVNGHRAAGRTVWVDLDNTPHVPFFTPIVRTLEQLGHVVILTYRDAFQVSALVHRYRLSAARVGRHYGKNRVNKLAGLVWRSVQLFSGIRTSQPDLALSHGSRSQLLTSKFLRVSAVLIDDYEHSWYPPFARPDWWIVPETIPARLLSGCGGRVLRYQGIKEDVYAGEFRPDPMICRELGLAESDVVVTVRPPATAAHYHDRQSDTLFDAAMDRLCGAADAVKVVLLPRDERQLAELRARRPAWFRSGRVVVPPAAVDGLNLVYHSDLVVSAGGTMNREATALGVPAYSIFRGPVAAVDRQLEAQGLLVMVRTVAEVRDRIRIRPRSRTGVFHPPVKPACAQICAAITEILDRI